MNPLFQFGNYAVNFQSIGGNQVHFTLVRTGKKKNVINDVLKEFPDAIFRIEDYKPGRVNLPEAVSKTTVRL